MVDKRTTRLENKERFTMISKCSRWSHVAECASCLVAGILALVGLTDAMCESPSAKPPPVEQISATPEPEIIADRAKSKIDATDAGIQATSADGIQGLDKIQALDQLGEASRAAREKLRSAIG